MKVVTDLMELTRSLIQEQRAFRLSPRERDVLTLVAAGYANREIGRELAVSDETNARRLETYFKSGSGKAFARKRFLAKDRP